MARGDTLAWVDVAKGIGILMVVFGHIVPGEFSQVLYIAHMPLFFAISGFLFNPKVDQRRFMQDRALHLLVPYACFMVLLFMPTALPRALRGEGWSALLPALVGGRWLGGQTTPFWFVTCLFLVQVLMNGLMGRLSRQQVVGVMGLFLLLAWIHDQTWPDLWLPWNASVVLMAAPFFMAGYLLRRHQARLDDWWFLSAALSIAAVALQWLSGLNTHDMKQGRYGIPVLTFVSALAMIHLTVLASSALAERPGASSVLGSLGRASMMIMFLHEPVQLVMQRFAWTAPTPLRLAAGVLLPWLAWQVVRRHATGRALLLGSAADLRAMRWPWEKRPAPGPGARDQTCPPALLRNVGASTPSRSAPTASATSMPSTPADMMPPA